MTGRSILITGSTGSFGSAFLRHLVTTTDATQWRRIICMSRDWVKQADLRTSLPVDDRVRWLLGDVKDSPRLQLACRDVQVVIHAAATKEIEVCEANPSEAVAVNVTGTENVIRACLERGVERAVFLSSDKAVAPVTCYGAMKQVGERLWVQSNVYAAGTGTIFSATRYGNVIGSRGSVIPIWQRQAVMDGHLTMTDASASRFWMSLNQAIGVVESAIERMTGGEVFVPKVAAATLATVAAAVAPSVPWQVIGLRPGEKRHETLISMDESRQVRDLGDLWMLAPLYQSWSAAPPVGGAGVPSDFAYCSETAPQLSVSECRELMGSAQYSR